MRRVLVLVAMFGCGDNDPAPPTFAVPQVALERVPVSVMPGGTVPVHVAIEGDASASELVITIRAPGPALPADPPRFVETGVTPALGDRSWLVADGTWSPTEVAIAATTADLSLTLPTAAVGQWTIAATLRGKDGGTITSGASASLIASTTPAIALTLDRMWASPGDLVRVRADVANRGNLEMVAWLTLPDGSQLTLPYLQPYLGPVDTTVIGDRVALLDRNFAAYGAGDYRVAMRLLDPATSAAVAAAGAGFRTVTAWLTM